MAFIVKAKKGLITWHIPSLSPIPKHAIDLIEWLQADGDELDVIRRVYKDSVPMPPGDIARWYGDIARTILFSL